MTYAIQIGDTTYPVEVTKDLQFTTNVDGEVLVQNSAAGLRLAVEEHQRKRKLKINIPLITKIDGKWQVVLFRGFSGRTNNPLITTEQGEKKELEYMNEFYSLELKPYLDHLNALEDEIRKAHREITNLKATASNVIRTGANVERLTRVSLQNKINTVMSGKQRIEGITYGED